MALFAVIAGPARVAKRHAFTKDWQVIFTNQKGKTSFLLTTRVFTLQASKSWLPGSGSDFPWAQFFAEHLLVSSSTAFLTMLQENSMSFLPCANIWLPQKTPQKLGRIVNFFPGNFNVIDNWPDGGARTRRQLICVIASFPKKHGIWGETSSREEVQAEKETNNCKR